MKAYGKRLGKIVILAAVLNFLIEFISRKSLAVLWPTCWKVRWSSF